MSSSRSSMLALTSTICIIFNAALLVNAKFYVTVDASGLSCHAGQTCTVNWQDDKTQPSLSAMGTCTVGLYHGEMQLVQNLQNVDVSAVNTLTFTVDGSVGPNFKDYYVAFTSINGQDGGTKQPIVGYTPSIQLDGMTGSTFADKPAPVQPGQPVPPTQPNVPGGQTDVPGGQTNVPGPPQNNVPGTPNNVPGSPPTNIPAPPNNVPGSPPTNIPAPPNNVPGSPPTNIPAPQNNVPGPPPTNVPGTQNNVPGPQTGAPGVQTNQPGQSPAPAGNTLNPGVPSPQNTGNAVPPVPTDGVPGSQPSPPGSAPPLPGSQLASGLSGQPSGTPAPHSGSLSGSPSLALFSSSAKPPLSSFSFNGTGTATDSLSAASSTSKPLNNGGAVHTPFGVAAFLFSIIAPVVALLS